MKKDVLINIKGIQHIDDQSDTTEVFTQGVLYKKNDSYYLTYEESQATGFEGSKTTLKVEGEDRVTLMRNGLTRTHLVVQKGERNVGIYGTGEGEMSIGVNSKSIKSTIDDNGGDLFFSYSIDINSSFVSENEVYIHVQGN